MGKISKGHNSIKNVSEVTVLVSAYCLMMFIFVQSFMKIFLTVWKL